MDEQIYILTAAKFLEMCGCDKDTAIYSILPTIDKKPEHYKKLYGHILKNQPELLDCALEIFTGKRTEVARSSYAYTRVKEEKESFLNLFGQARKLAKLPSTISSNKLAAALSLISHSYMDSFFYPIQFFLPHSSVCSGQWGFWDKIDYLKFIENIYQKGTMKLLTKKLLKSNVWGTKFKPGDFPEIVKRRLLKEKLLGKKLNPEAMIKAMIIRMGELATPSINYEVIDFSIRSFFTYLGVKKYLRVDREILFLRRFEKEFTKILASLS
jgi:hypothetical protein